MLTAVMVEEYENEGLELCKLYDKPNTFPTGAVLLWYLHTQRGLVQMRRRES